MIRPVRALSYGGGTNSTALLLEAHRRGELPDLVVFADTGTERPETYAYLDVVDAWLHAVGGPRLQVVRWIRRDGTFLPLHAWCERYASLPSAAFGLRGCTSKWKQQPLEEAVRRSLVVEGAHARGERVERWVGFDADEHGRVARLADRPEADLWTWRAPLHEWDLDRAACVEVIRAAGLPLPGKSACWICPHLRREEVTALGVEHPDLAARALAIERAAQPSLGTVKGLGRRWAWSEALARPDVPLPPPDDLPCGCADLRVPRARPWARSRPYAPRAARLDAWRPLLGLVADAELARRAGVTRATVARMRHRVEGRGHRSLL